MAVDNDLLTKLSFHKGAPAMTSDQFRARCLAYMDSVWPLDARMSDEAGFKAWHQGILETLATARANLYFNRDLAAYREATARLARYRLADGREEATEDQPIGELDDEGTPVLVAVVVQTAIDPLPATVSNLDENGDPIEEPNPLIVTDDAERAEAQAVIDDAPKAIIEFGN